MATAKLWWDGSAWATAETNWFSGNTGSYPAVIYSAKIIVYDDFTIKLTANAVASTSDGVLQASNGHIFRENGTAVFTLKGNNHSFSGSATLSSSTATVSHGTGAAESIAVYRAISGTPYGTPWTGSHSTNITNPYCTITYKSSDGETTLGTQTVIRQVSNTLSYTTPIRTNHTFLGWASTSGAHVADIGTSSYTPASDEASVTVYAVWGPAVFIDVDGGTTISLNSVSYTNETTVVQNLVWGNSYPITTTANTGYIVKEQSHPDGTLTINADETDVSATGQRVGCHIDDGEEWVQAVMYLDTGSEWVMVQAYYDNGNSWELVY